ESHDDGLIQRILPIVVRPGAAGGEQPTHQVVDAYARFIESLHKLEPAFALGWANTGQAAQPQIDQEAHTNPPPLAPKDPELQRLTGVKKKLAAHIGKSDAFWARLCIVFHCIEHVTASASGPAQQGMPFMITEAMKQKLLACGVTDAEIHTMTPERALERLA